MRVVTLALLAALLILPGCSNAGSSTPAEDAQNLQGSWKLISATCEGESISDDVRWTFDGDQVIVAAHGSQEKSQFKLGTAGRNTIFVKHHDNPLAGQGFIGGTLTGIYSLAGDRLRFCYDLSGQHYPKTFEAKKGSRQIVYELARDQS
jgi:uncharacterized protein (TIGR03067 family)